MWVHISGFLHQQTVSRRLMRIFAFLQFLLKKAWWNTDHPFWQILCLSCSLTLAVQEMPLYLDRASRAAGNYWLGPVVPDPSSATLSAYHLCSSYFQLAQIPDVVLSSSTVAGPGHSWDGGRQVGRETAGSASASLRVVLVLPICRQLDWLQSIPLQKGAALFPSSCPHCWLLDWHSYLP